MVMMQTQVLGGLRRDVIKTIGIDAARRLFYRTGWRQGQLYADLVRKRFHQEDLTAALAAGASMVEAMEIAMAAAHLVIQQLGTTGTASVPEIRKLLL